MPSGGTDGQAPHLSRLVGKTGKLLQALTRGLEEVAHVDPWTTSFNPGTTTLDRLVELAHQVDFAAFVFAKDDWTSVSLSASPDAGAGQASPRDNVVFEAGLFGGVIGMRRTFILHAKDAKLPSDLLGLTCIRYGETTPAEVRVVNQKLRKAIEDSGRLARIDGLWWQFSLTELSALEPSAVGVVRIARDRDGALDLHGQSWQQDGRLSARWSCEASRERKDPSGAFYYWRGNGLGTRAHRSWREPGRSCWSPPIARPDTSRPTRARLRARARGRPVCTGAASRGTSSILDGSDERQRAELIAERLGQWRSITNG